MLAKNKKAFLNNKIDKYQYMERMNDIHKILYKYAEFINKSNVLDITIKNGQVYFNFLSNGFQIKMVSSPADIASVPFTLLNFGSYEPVEEKILLAIVQDNDVVLDVGANSGWYTLNWLKKAKGVTIYSFEPIPILYDNLIQNLVLNGEQVKNAFNYGLSNINKDLVFFFDKERFGASSVVNLRGTKNVAKVKCTVKKLDDVFPSFGVKRLDFIKCDVEGAELFVFEGGIKTIKRYKPIVFSEILRKWSKKLGYHPNDVINLFRSIGYQCYIINNDKIEKFGLVDDGTIQTNYLFFHKEKHVDIIKNLSAKIAKK